MLVKCIDINPKYGEPIRLTKRFSKIAYPTTIFISDYAPISEICGWIPIDTGEFDKFAPTHDIYYRRKHNGDDVVKMYRSGMPITFKPNASRTHNVKKSSIINNSIIEPTSNYPNICDNCTFYISPQCHKHCPPWHNVLPKTMCFEGHNRHTKQWYNTDV